MLGYKRKHAFRMPVNLGQLGHRTFIIGYKIIIRKMNIGDLKAGMRNVNVMGKIETLKDTRTVNLRSGGTAQVADAILSDETGTIKLSLWDDQIQMVGEGDDVSIENGYTQSFRGENSLNIGRYGKLSKI